MRIKQIKNLLSMRSNYHPFLGKLFRKYRAFPITLFMNVIVGASCLLLLSVIFYGLYAFFSVSAENPLKVLLECIAIVFSFSILSIAKSMYSFLYSGKDVNFLKTLPILRSEIVFSNFVYFYKKQILVSIYIFATSATAIFFKNNDFIWLILNAIFAFIVPVIAIFISFLLSSIANFISKKVDIKKRQKKFSYKTKSSVRALINYEMKNISNFSSLKLELFMQLLFFVAFTFTAIMTNYKYLGFLIIYPVLSMINVSSFSREGEFHKMLESFLISKEKRILSKLIFYCILVFPLFFISFTFVALKTKNFMIALDIIPSLLFIINISLMALISDRKSPKTNWTNPQEAFRMNFSILFLGILLGSLTSWLIFFSDFFMIPNTFIGFAISVILNLMILLLLIVKMKK